MVCVCMCVSVISITQKKIAADTSNFVFYICILFKCNIKLSMKIGKKLCVEGITKNFNTLKDYRPLLAISRQPPVLYAYKPTRLS